MFGSRASLGLSIGWAAGVTCLARYAELWQNRSISTSLVAGVWIAGSVYLALLAFSRELTRAHDETGAHVYRHRGMLFAAMMLSLGVAGQMKASVAPEVSGLQFFIELLIRLSILSPLAVWAGIWWRRAMDKFRF